MLSNVLTRRDFSISLASLFSYLGTALPGLGSVDARTVPVEGSEEISHSAEAIHQEVVFNASRRRVYQALTDEKHFDKVVQLSQARMSYGSKPTRISREVGGAFSLFGGFILGRHIELVPNERLVQAWREASWKPGVYSIVKFDLTEQGSGTKLTFDHTGFPNGASQQLASGWKANYWEPLAKYLA